MRYPNNEIYGNRHVHGIDIFGTFPIEKPENGLVWIPMTGYYVSRFPCFLWIVGRV